MDSINSILALFGMEHSKSVSIPVFGSEVSAEEPAETLANEEDTQDGFKLKPSLSCDSRMFTRYNIIQYMPGSARPTKVHTCFVCAFLFLTNQLLIPVGAPVDRLMANKIGDSWDLVLAQVGLFAQHMNASQ